MEKEDIRLMIGNVKFGCRAVGVIIKDDKILFQKRKNDANWALPGGAIATLETGEEVVLREKKLVQQKLLLKDHYGLLNISSTLTTKHNINTS